MCLTLTLTLSLWHTLDVWISVSVSHFKPYLRWSHLIFCSFADLGELQSKKIFFSPPSPLSVLNTLSTKERPQKHRLILTYLSLLSPLIILLQKEGSTVAYLSSLAINHPLLKKIDRRWHISLLSFFFLLAPYLLSSYFGRNRGGKRARRIWKALLHLQSEEREKQKGYKSTLEREREKREKTTTNECRRGKTS